MDTLFVAIAAGLSLGLIIGYRGSIAVVRRIAGPFARKPLVIGCAVAGGCGFLAPASLLAIFATRNLGGAMGSAINSGSPGALLGIAIGITVMIASGIVVGVFAGTLCATFIEQGQANR